MDKIYKDINVVSFSGAATKIVAHIAHAQNLVDKGFKPNVYAGLSSGILTAIAYAFDKLEFAEEVAKNLEFSDIFGKIPVNKEGKLTTRGALRGFTKGAFGTSNGLINTLKRFVSEKEWKEFVEKDTKKLYCGVYNITRHKYEVKLLNKLSYDEFILYSVASCTIPLYCSPVKIGNHYLWDGGVFRHNPCQEIINLYNNRIDEVVSIYSRPEKLNLLEDWGFNGKSIGRALSVLIETMTNAISLSNQSTEKLLASDYNIKLTQLFAPKVLKGVYDINKERLIRLYDLVRNKFK